MNILLGITGSVAALYTHKLIIALESAGHSVNVITTKSSDKFDSWRANLLKTNHDYSKCTIYDDESEMWSKLNDSILHIMLRDWADCLVIAPLSSNTLAKIANGMCDNLLTEVVRAWDYGKPLIVCPAMNTMMWENEPTNTQIESIKSWGVTVINPISKVLACGDVGIGAMCDHSDIIKCVENARWANPLGKKFFTPKHDHPGAFGAVRKYDIHTGVDLYCNDNDPVYAVEDGEILRWFPFTGPKAGFPFWEDTSCVMIKGASGVINYGEVSAVYRGGTKYVSRGEHIANVKRVLKFGKERPDIPYHSLSMLHIELYRHGTQEPTLWQLDSNKPKQLLNPTSRLEQINTY